MKKRILSLVLVLAMAFGLVACNSSTDKEAETTEETEETGETPETTHIKWARGASGNSLVTIAKKLGYFEEYGLEVEEVPLDVDSGTALAAGQVDICANNGTNDPLVAIAAGDDITIFGGHMLTGCMPIIAKAGTEWNGITDFVGKTIATPFSQFMLTGALLREGVDPSENIEWLEIASSADRVAAVVSGEADYALVGTNQNYPISTMDDIEIMCYASDVTPDYSCCRMYTRTEFIENNPITCKLLCKALIRAQIYFDENREEVVTWMAEELETKEEYVASYMLNDHYQVNADPIKNKVIDAWNVLMETGCLPEKAANVNVEDHLNIELYQAALEELMADEEIYNADKEAYDKALTYFKENNL